MADYNSSYTGPQIDSAVGQVLGDTVIKNTAQTLTDAQKEQARSNIGAAQDEEVSDLKSAKAPVIIDTASGAIASFEDGADGMPLKSLTVNIEPVQEGSGDPSPENVRLISGWTGCNIYRSGADMSNPTTYSITFPSPVPGTVYGGTLDVVNKKLTVEYAGYTLDGSNMSGIDFSNVTDGIATFRMRLNGQYQFPALQIGNTIIFNYLDEKPVNTQAAWTFERLMTGTVTAQQTMYLKIPKSTLTANTIDGFAAYLSAHSLQVCYKLAAPVVYDLATTEITTLLGTNNIWADCGLVSVEYPVDTQITIGKQAAEISAIKSQFSQLEFSISDYGLDWSGNVSEKSVTKKGNCFSFGTGTLGAYRYFSLLSDTLYVSTKNNPTSVPEDAFTLQNKLEPHSTYELICRIGDNSNVGGSYLGIYDMRGNQITPRFTSFSAGKLFRATFVNDTVPIALLMQCNGTTQTDVASLTIAIRKIEPEWIYGDETKKKIRAGRWTKSSAINPVTLLHFSDTHGNGIEISRILAFYNAHSDLIQDMLCTGDLRLASVQSDFTFWEERDISKILVSLGNHDYYVNNTNDHSKSDIPTVIKTWIGDYSDGWGVTITSGSSYYYKDYDTGVRLIVLDCNLTSAEGGTAQKTWLANILANAKANGKAVVIACHYVYLGNSKTYTNIETDFTNEFAPTTSDSQYDWSPEVYTSTVQDFIDNGGTFICWLAGHLHADFMSYPTDYPNQLIITITAATANRTNLTLTSGDLERTVDTVTQDAFNIVTFDTANHLLKVVRIGADINTFMRPRKYICYNYAEHKFIS